MRRTLKDGAIRISAAPWHHTFLEADEDRGAVASAGLLHGVRCGVSGELGAAQNAFNDAGDICTTIHRSEVAGHGDESVHNKRLIVEHVFVFMVLALQQIGCVAEKLLPDRLRHEIQHWQYSRLPSVAILATAI
eukprot:CAMPEP_0170252712 /NCGR_PEP_ID=MMETSP0116_2-20130129/26192_1 /TAXON_ID=400756 /ORGANISM="Durinskia baltica, Strain CSIRO CS-38" /LENGTH=133 /DNA_ID=CAMNT_0010503687 /DNA_START=1 /DNA_END=403 /DNA_ORIENTATION=+